MPTCTSAARDRASASARLTFRCACTVSTIWVSTRRTGLRVIIGSWKIMAISAPRIARSRSGAAVVSSSPSSRIELPSTMRPGGSIRPRMEKPVTVLPEPGFAHQPEDLARRDLEIDAVDRLGDAFLGEEMRAQVADAERHAHRRFRGLSTSRRWSPARLMPMIAMASATPGKKLIQ